MIERATPDNEARRSLGLIGSAYGLDRQPDTMRFARDTASTRRDPQAWWEPHIPKDKPKPFGWAPTLKAPSGTMVALQRALLARPRRPLVTIDRLCWVAGAAGLIWLAWAALRGPGQ